MSESARVPESGPQPAEPRVSYVVARLDRALRTAINERVKPYDLTTLQYTTLSILGHSDHLSNAQLARRAYMTPQSMSEVLDALEQKHLIKRTPHPNHRRVYPATLTPKGHHVLTACNKAIDQLEHQMLANLTQRQITTLRKTLIEAVRSLHAGFPRRV